MQIEIEQGSDSGESKSTGRVKSILVQARRILPLALVILSGVMGLLLYNALFPAPIPPAQSEIDQNILAVMGSATPPAANSSQVYQVILPSLVLIQSRGEAMDEDDEVGVGSGVIVNEQGDILTALHVVVNALKIEVSFADGSHSLASIISSDVHNDIAVLHPDQPPQLIVPAVLSSIGAVRVGDEAFVVGNPLGLTSSMSAGVVSGFNRTMPIDESGLVLEGLIQFDAAVNPGNSGGPLLNRYGQVIGIVTGLANPAKQRSFSGIGFAVPITTAAGAAGIPAY